MTIYHLAAAAAKSLQSCPTLCDPIDGSPPGSADPGIESGSLALQADSLLTELQGKLQYNIQCKYYVNNCEYNVNDM